MKRSTDRILATHTGSLVRPPEIIRVMRAITAGRPYDEAAFAGDLRRSVAEVVRKEVAAGVDIPSDGEFGKIGWTGYAQRFAGLERVQGDTPASVLANSKDRRDFAEFWAYWAPREWDAWQPPLDSGEAPAPPIARYAVNGPITYRNHDVLRDIENFKAALQSAGVEDAFLPVVAPGSTEVMAENRYYSTQEDYLYALADALKEEYRAIIDAGLLLQVDDAFMPALWDTMFGSENWQEFRRFSEIRIEALNHALEGIPEDRVRYHICWGSWNGPHSTDVPLKDIIDLVLKVKAQAYSIEAANPRHEHEWQVWETTKLPDGKILIPGVVTHSTNIIEHPELVAWRIANFARLVGRENVIGGTDCGFSQFWNLIRTHETIQWAKLEALAEGARLATAQLWGQPVGARG